jgi:uncharacterized protein YcbX
MSISVTQLLRYPVKGLRADVLNSVSLTANCGFPFDRHFAIAHAESKVSKTNPTWVPRRNFIVVAHSPKVAMLSCRIDTAGQLTFTHDNGPSFSYSLNSDIDHAGFTQWLETYTGSKQPGPYSIVRCQSGSFTDSPVPAISIMNRASLRNLEQSAGTILDAGRFRGNVWIDGASAWQEADWTNAEISIGAVRLRIIDAIERCAAINANPLTGERDLNLLKILKRATGSVHFGVLAVPVADGLLSQGDQLIQSAHSTG